MPTTTLTSGHIFPPSTVVKAYLRGSWPAHLVTPEGAPDPELIGTGEVQTVTVDATGGDFTLTFGGQTTANISESAAASAVQSALEALSTIGVGNVAVTGSAGGPYTVTFRGELKGDNVAQLTSSAAGLTGGASTVTHATSTPGVDGYVESATVASDSTLAYTTLTAGTRYYAHAQVGGVERVVAFTGSA